jgi:hypothetical protein
MPRDDIEQKGKHGGHQQRRFRELWPAVIPLPTRRARKGENPLGRRVHIQFIFM